MWFLTRTRKCIIASPPASLHVVWSEDLLCLPALPSSQQMRVEVLEHFLGEHHVSTEAAGWTAVLICQVVWTLLWSMHALSVATAVVVYLESAISRDLNEFLSAS